MQIIECLKCGEKFELYHWCNDKNGSSVKCDKCNNEFDIIVESENDITETLLQFQIAGEGNNENAKRLCDLLDEKQIDYVGYDVESKCHRPLFFVRKGNLKWNDIMTIINSVKAPLYKKVKKTFYITKFMELARGNIIILGI